MISTRRTRCTILAILAAALAFGLGGVPAAAAPDAQDPDGVLTRLVATATGAVERYWTPQRRAGAVPLDLAYHPSTGTTQRTRPAAAPADAVRAGGRVPVPRAAGKLFFSDGADDYVCSATVIRSAAGNQVLTAGHCVHTGPHPSGSPLPLLGSLFVSPHYFENWMFVPRYRKGREPLGTWVAREVRVSSGWVEDEDYAEDQAVVVLRHDDGERVQDATGGYRVRIGSRPRQPSVRVWGWPAEDPYDGETAWRCDGRSTRARTAGVAGDAIIGCSMNGGASGGPWLRADRRRRPVLWAVTSRRLLDSPRLLAHPLPPTVRALRDPLTD